MNIITISREFGSGGREVGKRLADALGYTYYDREIEEGVAERMKMDTDYVARSIEQGVPMNVPLHFGRTLAGSYLLKQQVDILVEKQRILKELASSTNCVIVGRAADVILADYRPFKIFVYADLAHRLKRCQAYAEVEENLSPRELEREIRKIDARRAQYRRMYLDADWGERTQYHLCVNTSGIAVKHIIPMLAGYADSWFQHSKAE